MPGLMELLKGAAGGGAGMRAPSLAPLHTAAQGGGGGGGAVAGTAAVPAAAQQQWGRQLLPLLPPMGPEAAALSPALRVRCAAWLAPPALPPKKERKIDR